MPDTKVQVIAQMPNVVVAIQENFSVFHNQQVVCTHLEIYGQPSSITIKQEAQIRTDLRDSLSVLNQFDTILPDKMQGVFSSNPAVGIGSRHCYLKNKGFMKEHVDIRLADLDRRPHWGTLVLTNNIDSLRICGKPVPLHKRTDKSNQYAVLFSLDCPHEVLISDQDRVSYTFPVFGRTAEIITVDTRIQNKFDIILCQIEEYQQKGGDVRIVDAYVNLLGYDEICRDRLKKLIQLQQQDDYYQGDIIDVDADFLLKALRIRVEALRQSAQEEEEVPVEFEKKTQLAEDQYFPTIPFVIELSATYSKDATVESLCVTDKEIYDRVCGLNRSFTFLPRSAGTNGLILKQVSGYLQPCIPTQQLKACEDVRVPAEIANVSTEFNDFNAFYAYYDPVRAYLVVN